MNNLDATSVNKMRLAIMTNNDKRFKALLLNYLPTERPKPETPSLKQEVVKEEKFKVTPHIAFKVRAIC